MWKLRYDACRADRHPSKWLYIVENFSLAAALAKGRSPAFCLLTVRRHSAQTHVRWLPYGLNAADSPSRVFKRGKEVRLLSTRARGGI